MKRNVIFLLGFILLCLSCTSGEEINKKGLSMSKMGNQEEARRLFSEACNKKYWLGCVNLGQEFKKDGTEAEAKRLFKLACDNGEVQGCEQITKMRIEKAIEKMEKEIENIEKEKAEIETKCLETKQAQEKLDKFIVSSKIESDFRSKTRYKETGIFTRTGEWVEEIDRRFKFVLTAKNSYTRPVQSATLVITLTGYLLYPKTYDFTLTVQNGGLNPGEEKDFSYMTDWETNIFFEGIAIENLTISVKTLELRDPNSNSLFPIPEGFSIQSCEERLKKLKQQLETLKQNLKDSTPLEDRIIKEETAQSDEKGEQDSTKASPGENEVVQSEGNSDEIRQIVNRWKAAWENTTNSMDGYSSFYDQQFYSNYRNMNYDQWMADKANWGKKANSISVEISNLNISINGDEAQASFEQAYISDKYSDRGLKTLKFIRRNNEWKIIGEEFKK